MRWLPLVCALVGLAGPAAAQTARTYPWCIVHLERNGVESCAFTSFEQCRMSTGGNAGFCMQNPAYAAPATSSRAAGRARSRE